MTGTQEKLRGITLAVLMVFSVFAGTVAFSGTVAAAGNAQFDNGGAPAGSVSGLEGAIRVGNYDQASSTFSSVGISFSGSSPSWDGSFNQVSDSEVNVYVYDDLADFQSGNTQNAKAAYSSDASINTADSNSIRVDLPSTSVTSDDYIVVDIEDSVVMPSSQGQYDGEIRINPQSDPSSPSIDRDTGTLDLGTAQQDDGDSGLGDDATWESSDRRYQGQDLLFNAAGNENRDFTLQTCNYDQVEDQCTGNDPVKAVDPDGDNDGNSEVSVIDTSSLEGEYVIVDEQGDYQITNENGLLVDEVSPGSATTNPSTNIVVQDLTTEFDSDSVAKGQSDTLTVETSLRTGTFTVRASSDDLSQADLASIFKNANNVQEPSDSDNVTFDVSGTSTSVSADFTGIDTGDYDFDFEVTDTTASDSAGIEVTAEEDTTASFQENVYVEQRGDKAEITLDVQNTDTLRVVVGSEDVNYKTSVGLRDSDEDGEVSFTVNTYNAGQDAIPDGQNVVDEADGTGSLVYEASEENGGTTVRFARRSTEQLNVPALEAATYDLTASIQAQDTDAAQLSLEERSTNGGRVLTAPSNFRSSTQNTAFDDVSDIRSDATATNRIAEGDLAIFQVNATGFGGYIDGENVDPSNAGFSAEDTDGTLEQAILKIQEASAGVNADPEEYDISNARVFTDADNSTLYVVIDQNSYSDQFEDGDKVEFQFILPSDNRYVQNKEDPVTSKAQYVNRTFTVDERDATFDTDEDGIVTVEPEAGQTISGSTTVAPGTDLTIRAAASGVFIKTADVTVADNRTFSGQIDFSNVTENTSFTASIPNQNFPDNAETAGRVGAAETASATFNNQTFTGQATSVEVESVTTSDGGFVTIHDSTLVSDGAVFDSVRGTSGYLEAGTTENVTVELDSPIAPSGSGTYYAMPHLDTDGDQTYDFVTSEGAEDGPYTDNEGNATVDAATITVERVATVTLNDQTTNGDSVLVESARLPDGGFVTIHDATVSDDPFGSVRGTSAYLDSGTSADINVSLDTPIEESGQFFAMPHRDTDGDETYDFVSSNGDDDGPYLNADGQIVLDSGQISLAGEMTATPTPTEADEPTPTPTEADEPTPTDEETTTTSSDGQPGFGLAVSLIALVGAALIALRRRD